MKVYYLFTYLFMTITAFSFSGNAASENYGGNNPNLRDDPYAYITVSNNSETPTYEMQTCDSLGTCSSIDETKLFQIYPGPGSKLTVKVLDSSGRWICYDFPVSLKGVTFLRAEGTKFQPKFTSGNPSIISSIPGSVEQCKSAVANGNGWQ